MTNDELLDLAAEYVAAGIPCFAIELVNEGDRIAKKPTTRNGHHDATLDLEHLRDQLESSTAQVKGIGIVPGAAGIVVIDYDTKHGAKGGLMLEHHRALYGDEADAVSYTSISGATNVFHLKRDDVEISNASPWPDVDIRADRGWVVPPGVVTPWGEWAWRSGDVYDIAKMPESQWEKLTTASTVHSAPADMAACREWLNGGADVTDVVEEMRLRHWQRELQTTGTRNPTLFEALTDLRRFDPKYVDRAEWFGKITESWNARMVADGVPDRSGEPLSVLTRVVGHARELEEIEAEIEAQRPLVPDSVDWVDYTDYLDGKYEPLIPDLVRMDDGRGLLYRERFNLIHGDSGAGKSWIAALAIKQEAMAGNVIAVMDIEDTPQPLIERLLQLGLGRDDILNTLVIAHPTEALEGKIDRIVENITTAGACHLFIDSLGEAFALSGVDENKDVEVTPWLKQVVTAIIDRTDAGVTVIDHGTKAAEKPLHPSGSKRKRAALTGTGWLLEAAEPFTKVDDGYARLVCAKDRHGNYRAGDHIGSLKMMHLTEERSMMTLEAVEPQEQNHVVDQRTPEELVTIAAESIRDWQSVNSLLNVVKRQGNGRRREDLIGGVDEAIRRGFLESRSGPRNSRQVRYVRDYEPLTTQDYLGKLEEEE